MIPTWTRGARMAKAVFYDQQIDIYVEDGNPATIAVHTILFRRLFEDKYKVHEAISLGSRQNVIEEHRKIQRKPRRPVLFVIDGDLHLMIGNSSTSSKGLFVLPCYCIENILVDPEALLAILKEEAYHLSDRIIKDKFGYSRWAKEHQPILFRLY